MRRKKGTGGGVKHEGQIETDCGFGAGLKSKYTVQDQSDAALIRTRS